MLRLRSRRPVLVIVAVAALATSCGCAAAASPTTETQAFGKPDTVAPIVLAEPQVGTVNNRFLPLEFDVWDNSDYASVHVWLEHGTTVIRRSNRGTLKTGFYNWYWRPRTPGSYRFCVAAIDAAGNKSRTRCTPVTIFKLYPK